MKKPILAAFLSAIAAAAAAPAAAANLDFNAALISSCTLTVNTGGQMAVATNGTQMGSEVSGGSAATLNVVAVGTLPTLSFTAPSLPTSPAGWSASHTSEIRFTSLGSANQAYTTGASTFTLTGLTDLFTVHGRVTSSAGFAAGSYTLRTIVTCA